MSTSLGLTPRVKIFQCPHCKETIDAAAERCPFCSTPIDARSAESAAELMERVNQACSDASYLRIMAGLMWGFFVLSFIPLVGVLGSWGSWFLLVAVPVMAIRWRIRFGSLRPDDPGFVSAKKSTWTSLGMWVGFLVVMVIVSMIRAAATR
jgi:hypothetical protein